MTALFVVLGALEAGATAYPITAKWDFQNLIPATMADVNIQGTKEENVNSDVDGVSMHVVSNNGKLQYNQNGYAQFNTNTTIQVPVLTTTDVVTVVSYPGQSNYTVGGEDATGKNSFSHTATTDEVTQGYVEIVPKATAYIYSIQVVQNEPVPSGGIIQWKVSEAPTGGIVTHANSDILQIAFGTAVKDDSNDWTTANGSVSVSYKGTSYSFDKYATTSSVNGSNSSSFAADGSNNNNYIAFVPKYNGTLILVGHNMGTNKTDKPTWCYENGEVKSGTIIGDGSLSIDYDGKSDVRTLNGGTAVTGGIKISVTANKLYTFSIQGSKARWSGVIYEYTTTAPTPTPAGSYTNTWYFGKSNGAEKFALEKSAEYTYTVNDYPLVINTDAGKLNNASRDDQWAQCNTGTTFKVPVFEGAKLTWGTYKTGSEAGFTIDGQLYNTSYVATAEGTVSMTAKGIDYLSQIKIAPTTLYEITGTIMGGTINGASITLTANDNGQAYTATVAEGAFTLKVPTGTYIPSLGGDVAFVISEPASVTVSEAGSIGAITITAAQAQTVTGQITNAPAEAFTLTFTGNSHNNQVECAAGATSFTVSLDPDTYVISSSVGTLSPLSVESFTVLTAAVNHNIYFPEAAVPAATQQQITVDKTAAVAANVYNTVTDALAAAKAGSISSPVITLTSGQTYREQVIVDLANVTLKTSGDEKATITWYYGIGYAYYSLGSDGYYNKDRAMTRNSIKKVDPARWGATFLVRSTGSGFKAENIIFENSFNQYYTTEEVVDGVTPNGVQSITYNRQLTSGQSGYKEADTKAVTERACAIAFENSPTGCQLYNCVFRGSQDTFYSSGKLYVKNCNIIGNTDYMFGGGYVVFDDCDLTIGGYSDKETSAYMTAYKEDNTLDADKCYIFRDCTVKAGDRTYVMANLGRDWGGEGASVYYFNLKNEIGDKLSYTWTDMGKAVSAGTANLHIYDFDPTVNANYSSTGANGANVNGVVSDDDAKTLYTGVVTKLGFTPEQIYDITLDENSVYNDIRIAAANGGTGDVTITRNIAAGQWNTLCLPFSMTAAQVTETFGTGTKLAKFTSYDATTKELTMTSATDITAGQPCMIWVETAVGEAKTISGVTYSSADPVVTQSDVTFQGTYQSGNIPAGAYFVSANNLYQSNGSSTIKPFRGYFTAPEGARLLFADDATGIASIIQSTTRHEVYDLQGRKVNGKPQKGLYIIDGKKHTIK